MLTAHICSVALPWISNTAIGTDYANAEWVFQADARVKDYHKNMDGFMLSNWLEHMLLPAFKAKYPGKTAAREDTGKPTTGCQEL